MTNTAALPASITNLANPKLYLTCADTAKLIRKALKEAFPEIKFSVRSSVYAGGASVQVRWFMGPLVAEVETIAKAFSGASFDGMTDSTSYKTHALDGQPVSFGANYIFCTRDLDADTVDGLADILNRAGRDNWLTLAGRYGLAQQACAWLTYHMDAREAARSMLQVLADPRFADRRSKTAETVNVLSPE